jgi:molecular chaperone DnaK
MRNKIDYGIDLGTTNSAIARMENGVPTIKRTDTSMDIMPSCLHFNKAKDILTGVQASNIKRNDNTRALRTFETGNTNSFIEFKRMMGTSHQYDSSNMGKSFSPEQLSSQILIKLKSLVQDENINSVVITIPANFQTHQIEATMQAAKLSGFKQIKLLQEPVAAATAYGLESKNKNGYWLVFDFGGGTFDAALIKAEEAILSVKDTQGDSWLGGKNLDEAIVDHIFIPNLKDKFVIDSVLNNPEKKEILRNALKWYAEDVKNQLSFKDSCPVYLDDNDLQFLDDEGNEPILNITITKTDLERIFSPIFQKAIDLSIELLKRNNLKGSDLGALILVGGPTHSPILRKMLKEQISDKIDTNVDPMTIVAKGAALFASTISVSEEVKEITRDKTKLQLDIDYTATTVEPDTVLNLKILKDKTIGQIPEIIYAIISRFDGAWSSPKKLICCSKTTLIDGILLKDGESNSFDILLYDEKGNRLECQPNKFSILQGIGGLDEIQVLPFFIGIAKYFREYEKDLFEPVQGLDKNKKLPAIGMIDHLKTRATIIPGKKESVIRIPIFQGEYNAIGSNPKLNSLIEEVIITGENMPGVLPEGSDVEITIKVDRSQIMKFSAYFPLLEHTEELEIKIKNTDVPSVDILRKDLYSAKQTAQKVKANDSVSEIIKLENQLENEAGSADGKMKIQEALRKELFKLDSIEKTAVWTTLEKELKQEFFEFEDLIRKIEENGNESDLNMDKIKEYLEDYRKTIEQIIKDKDSKAAKELKEDIRSKRIVIINELTEGEDYINRLKYHDREFQNLKWKDKIKARELVNQGLQMIEDGKSKSLLPLLREIWDLRIDPQDVTGKETVE